MIPVSKVTVNPRIPTMFAFKNAQGESDRKKRMWKRQHNERKNEEKKHKIIIANNWISMKGKTCSLIIWCAYIWALCW